MGDDAAGRGLLSHAIKAGIDVSRVSVHQTLPCESRRECHPSSSTSSSSSSTSSSSSSTSSTNNAHVGGTLTRTDTPVSTASYCAIHDSTGQLVAAVADVRIIAALTPDSILEHSQAIKDSQLVVVDGNLLPATFEALVRHTADLHVPLFFEPTSDHKCILPILTNTISKVPKLLLLLLL